jgi:hypothetical protein
MKRTARMKEREAARLQKMRSMVQFFGKGLWKGDLSEMRDDRLWQPVRRPSKTRSLS